MTDAGSPSAGGMTLTSRANTTDRLLGLYLGWHGVVVIQAEGVARRGVGAPVR